MCEKKDRLSADGTFPFRGRKRLGGHSLTYEKFLGNEGAGRGCGFGERTVVRHGFGENQKTGCEYLLFLNAKFMILLSIKQSNKRELWIEKSFWQRPIRHIMR